MGLNSFSRRLFVRFALLTGGVLLFAASGFAEWPDLPGKAVALKMCSNCHEPERAESLRQGKDGWDATIASMVGRGMEISDTDYATVLEYFSKAFPAPEVPPLNINTASGIDLESALSLLRSEAAAVVAYRTKNGKFKSLDDLKKVTGVPFAKIEAKKDRIVF